MLSFKQYLAEGGNIKVGDAGAAPLDVTKRPRGDITADIHGALSDIHDHFKNQHGSNLFGAGKKALKTGSAFSGSSNALFGKHISDEEYKTHKPSTGDVDVQVPHEHMDKLPSTLTTGNKFGKYEVVGTKKHGKEISALIRHNETGHTHQLDFQGVAYKGDEPTEGSRFLHSSNWDDTKAGFKGAHHKILINAAGGEKHKFSISHGLKSREDTSKNVGETRPTEISKTLFGHNANHSDIHSFTGVAELIRKHVPKERHQAIYDKFKDGVKKSPFNSDKALSHLRTTLGVKDTVTEAKEEVHHTTVIPMVGFSPFSHMGHAEDLGKKMGELPGSKHIGFKDSKDEFSFKERSDILKRQWKQPNTEIHQVTGAGATIAHAHDSLPKTGKKVLHILVGADRKDFAHGLKKSLEAGKIKEMAGKSFDEIHIHHPEDLERTHGMSGTKMRAAASEGNLKEFHRHIGSSFSKDEAQKLMSRVQNSLSSGSLKLKR